MSGYPLGRRVERGDGGGGGGGGVGGSGREKREGKEERGVFASKLRKERQKKRERRGGCHFFQTGHTTDYGTHSAISLMLKDPGKGKKGGLDVMIGYMGEKRKREGSKTFLGGEDKLLQQQSIVDIDQREGRTLLCSFDCEMVQKFWFFFHSNKRLR